MRTTIIAIIVWAVLLGCVLTGAKVMATSAGTRSVDAIGVTTVQERVIQPGEFDRSNADAKFLPVERDD